MKIGNHIFFAPDLTFSEVHWDDPVLLLDEYKQRLLGFYIGPAWDINPNQNPFASGVIAVCAIDSLVKISKKSHNDTSMQEYEQWLIDNIVDFNQPDPQKRYEVNRNNVRYPRPPNLARRFYKEVRCGLVHEGILKEGAQFDVELIGTPVDIVDELMIINPYKLLEKTELAIDITVNRIKNDSDLANQFLKSVKLMFNKEYKLINCLP